MREVNHWEMSYIWNQKMKRGKTERKKRERRNKRERQTNREKEKELIGIRNLKT